MTTSGIAILLEVLYAWSHATTIYTDMIGNEGGRKQNDHPTLFIYIDIYIYDS